MKIWCKIQVIIYLLQLYKLLLWPELQMIIIIFFYFMFICQCSAVQSGILGDKTMELNFFIHPKPQLWCTKFCISKLLVTNKDLKVHKVLKEIDERTFKKSTGINYSSMFLLLRMLELSNRFKLCPCVNSIKACQLIIFWLFS